MHGRLIIFVTFTKPNCPSIVSGISIYLSEDAVNKNFIIDGLMYDQEQLSDDGKLIFKKLVFAERMTQESKGLEILLNRAKNSYITDIKEEIVQQKSGVDFALLLQDD